jgi:hypothetical protein
VSGGNGVTSFSPSITATTTYYAQARNTSTSCVSATRLAVSGTMNALPTVSLGNPSGTCSNVSITLTATGSNVSSWAWSGSGGGSGSGAVYTISSPTVGSKTVTVTGTSSAGCTASASKTFSIVQCCSEYGQPVGSGCCPGLTAADGVCSASTFTGCKKDGGGTLIIAYTDQTGPVSQAEAKTACPSGWRLPSKAEQDCMKDNRTQIPGLTNMYHWNSYTKGGNLGGWCCLSSCGESCQHYTYAAAAKLSVRCVKQ